ncbi:endonuclease domain-containing protein [Aquimarina sp. ERC-38]|uniref:DUF559 domain-containing protein n=1 Tax=Aquimarina sp. ERC-38 TaxID=2949996 RepID=UPI00224742AE|nr:DUF559 domain-containing protein [Aquimarina sp. ERC-38]UZO81074.1 endonuclease domain-containing protein [Aquimarina sp. ERC-38]
MEKIQVMTWPTLSLSTTTNAVIRHSLHNALPSMTQLEELLNDKGFTFSKNHRIHHYHFDFYDSKHKIALKIDDYLEEFDSVNNTNSIKKLYIPSLQVHVLKFTDYHILTDPEEIIRAIKFLIQNKLNVI